MQKANILIKLLLLGLVWTQTACILRSWNPFYQENQLITDGRLEGRFVSKNDDLGEWVIQRLQKAVNDTLQPTDTYRMRYWNQKAQAYTGELDLHLFELEGIYYVDLLDVSIENLSEERTSPFMPFSQANAHLLAKVEWKEEGFTFWFLSEEAIKKMRKKHYAVRNHPLKAQGASEYLVTASTQKLQKLIRKKLKKDSFWDTEYSMQRI